MSAVKMFSRFPFPWDADLSLNDAILDCPRPNACLSRSPCSDHYHYDDPYVKGD